MADIKSEPIEKGKPTLWQKTPTPCLLKYAPAGTYYLRARVNGEPYREALGTTVYEVARRKLVERLHELRLSRSSYSAVPRTLGEALAVVRAKIQSDASLRSRTRADYMVALDRLAPGKPGAVPHTALSRLTPRDLAPWWQAVCNHYGPQRANHLLMLVRRALKFARKAGALVADPTEELKRAKIQRTRLNLISLPQFQQIAAEIRGQRKAWSQSSADWVEFQAYSGLRPGEMLAIRWEHIDETRGVLWVHGGEEGTKNGESRPVPILPDMRRLLGGMRTRCDTSGLIFPRKHSPRDALHNACDRLSLPRLRIYDLRHLFATTCNAAGVDVPTFAKWLGHRDGGALAMRTYVHPHDEHSRESAAKVRFSL